MLDRLFNYFVLNKKISNYICYIALDPHRFSIQCPLIIAEDANYDELLFIDNIKKQYVTPSTSFFYRFEIPEKLIIDRINTMYYTDYDNSHQILSLLQQYRYKLINTN